MATQIILFLDILIWSIIAGQSYMYIIALMDVSKKLDAPGYIRFRQLVDRNFMAKYKWVVYAAMLLGPLLCILAATKGNIVFVCSLVTLLALVSDLVLTLRGNMPINKLINTWSTNEYPIDWEIYRNKWLSVFFKRQVVTIIGFISLVTAAIFGNR